MTDPAQPTLQSFRDKGVTRVELGLTDIDGGEAWIGGASVRHGACAGAASVSRGRITPPFCGVRRALRGAPDTWRA